MDRHDGQGLYQHTRNAVAFRSITFNDLPYNLSKPVRALYIDHERSLWVGTKGEGLLRIPNFYHRKTFDASHVEQITTANSELLDSLNEQIGMMSAIQPQPAVDRPRRRRAELLLLCRPEGSPPRRPRGDAVHPHAARDGA